MPKELGATGDAQGAPRTHLDERYPDFLPYSRAGTLTVAAGTLRLPVSVAGKVTKVMATVGTAPTGASVKVDVNKNGTTIFSTQGNRPDIAASAFASTAGTPDANSFSPGDYITVDVDQVGSTIAGQDLVVVVVFQVT